MKTSYFTVLTLALLGTVAVAAEPAGKKPGAVPRLKVATPDNDKRAADAGEDASEKKTARKPAKPGGGLKLSTGGKPDMDEAEIGKKLSYMLGFGTGKQISQFEEMGIKIDMDVVMKSLRDAAEGKESAMSDEESQTAAQEVQEFVQQRYAAKNKRDGEKFLAENKKREGVKALPSGLQYKIIKSGKGEKPRKTDVVRAHYEGKLIDGTVFDSSYRHGQPASFPLDRVIKGWTEALQLMKVGDKWKLFIPSDLAYEEAGRQDQQGRVIIPPNATLVFEVELLGIEKGPKGPALK